MLELDHLTVSGDVTFGKNVALKVGDWILYTHLGFVCLNNILNMLHLLNVLIQNVSLCLLVINWNVFFLS